MCYSNLYWPVKFILRNLPIILWKFSFVWWVTYLLLLSRFFVTSGGLLKWMCNCAVLFEFTPSESLRFSKLYISLFHQMWEVFSLYFFEISFLSFFVSPSGISIMCISVHLISSVLSLSSCTTLCGPMDCSAPGHPVHHELLEFTQTHVHWVGDAIQPS